jgi:serine/threonine kinase 3
MRALFMIPQHPPPTVLDKEKWSAEFLDFLKFVLVKNPALRPDAGACLRHPFFKNTPGPDVIVELLQQSEEIVKKRGFRIVDSSSDEESDDDSGSDADSQDSDGLESGDDGTDPGPSRKKNIFLFRIRPLFPQW